MRGKLGEVRWAPTLVDAECALASKVPVDGLGLSQTRNLLTDVTVQGRLPWNEAEAESVLDHGKPSGRKVQALAISAVYWVTCRRRVVLESLLVAVTREAEAELGPALGRLLDSSLLFQQGVPPQATYLFKHALIRDAAYGTLLREPRRALHARIAEALEREFPEIAETQPELVAHHYSEAGLIDKAAGLWGKAGQRALERSALLEAAEQLGRALAQIATLPGTPALRSAQIKLQIALITPLIHIKGYAAPETKAAEERARLLIAQAEALGEPPDDPLLLFSVLYGVCVANSVAFDGDKVRELAAQFLSLAEKQSATVPLMIGHRISGFSLLATGDVARGRIHLDQAVGLYDPAEHRRLATRFGVDTGTLVLCLRSWALWMLGYPESAVADIDRALSNAREIGQAPTLMFGLNDASFTHLLRGNYPAANALVGELVALAEEKASAYWKASGTAAQGCILALTRRPLDAVQRIAGGIRAARSTGATLHTPMLLSHLAAAYADLRQFDDASRCVDEAITTVNLTKERWWESDINRIAGEIALKSPAPDTAKAQAHFQQALAVARAQQAKSWELRAAMSMARLWRHQGKRSEARDLLASIYGWFTEGFDTLDLKEAKALLEQLRA
jgi:predicted ATPase